MLNSTQDVVGSSGVARHAAARDTTEAREPYGLNDLMALSVSTGAISPAMARTMRDTMHFDRQRPINERNVARLAEEMRRGWFLAGTPIFICVLPDGRQFILNGNHTLEGVAASGVTLPLTIIRKKVRDMEEAASVYATFDLQKNRSWRDTLQATGFSEDVPLANEVVSALGIIICNFQVSNSNGFMLQSRQLRLDALPEYVRPARLIYEAIMGAPRQSSAAVTRAGSMSVALFTARYQPRMAAEFWGGVAKDDGLRADDPRKVLLRWVINNPSRGSSNRATQIRAAANAWNAFFLGRTLTHLKPSISELRILGTPLDQGVKP